MRIKDDKKQEALFRATIKLVNDIGFASSSVSKIAKSAGVSPATLYTYFRNKDDLIVSTYMTVMDAMSAGIFTGLDTTLPVRDVLHQIWRNTFGYVQANRAGFLYTEQFAKSPYVQHLKVEDLKRFYAPLVTTIRRGVEEKVLKDVHFHMHAMFFLYPIFTLANPNSCHVVPIGDETVEAAFVLAWDAIRL